MMQRLVFKCIRVVQVNKSCMVSLHGVGFSIFCLKSASIFGGKVLPRSQIATRLRIFTLCSLGAASSKFCMREGMSSVILRTPEAKVPSSAALPGAWRSLSSHCLVTESTTKRTPSLCVAGVLLKWLNNF